MNELDQTGHGKEVDPKLIDQHLEIKSLKAKISELQAVIDEIMEIAHLGGLRNVDNEDALIAIRHLTKSRFEEIKGAWTSSHRTVDDQ